jgi:hypothetical protein
VDAIGKEEEPQDDEDADNDGDGGPVALLDAV